MSADTLLETYGDPTYHKIGYGTYGDVYVTDKGYVVKIMRLRGDIDVPELAGAVFPLCLNHDNIIKYYNVYIYTETINIVMKRYTGDLFHLHHKQPGVFKDMAIFKSLSTQMISAVAYLTSRGILHRDIKPPNILYQQISDNPKRFIFVLADFDAGRERRCETSDSIDFRSVYSTPCRPPEAFQIEDDNISYNESSDVWALGATLGTLYKGGNLFYEIGKTDMDVLHTIVKYIPRGNGPLSEKLFFLFDGYAQRLVDDVDVELFLRKMLRFEPSERTSIFELQHDEFLSGYVTNPIEPVPSTEKVLLFDRHIDFSKITSTLHLEIIWNNLVKLSLELPNMYKFKQQGIFLAAEIFGRYLLLDLPPEEDFTLALCASVYVGHTFIANPIDFKTLQFISKKSYEKEIVLNKCKDILKRLNFDLCAKTAYDDINRFNGKIEEKILHEATELLSFTLMDAILYFNPRNSIITFCIILNFFELKHDFDVTADEIEQWKKQFKLCYDTYVGNLKKRFGYLIMTYVK